MRRLSFILLTLLAAGCGSRPVQPPAAVSSTSTFMANGMTAYQDNRSVDDLDGQTQVLIDMADCALKEGDISAARANLAEARSLAAGHPALATLLPRITLYDAYADL